MSIDRFNDYSALSKPTSGATDISQSALSSNPRETLAQHAFDYTNAASKEVSLPHEAAHSASPKEALSFTDIMQSVVSFQKKCWSDVFHDKANDFETGMVLMESGIAVVTAAGAVLAAPEILGLAGVATGIEALEGTAAALEAPGVVKIAADVSLGGVASLMAGAGVSAYGMDQFADSVAAQKKIELSEPPDLLRSKEPIAKLNDKP